MKNKIIIVAKKYKVNSVNIHSSIEKVLQREKITKIVSVSISFVDDLEMTRLHKKYLKLFGTTDVLSFPLNELKSKRKSELTFNYPDNIIELGDIVVCYPQAARQAKESRISIDLEIGNLVEHGMRHLLGIHHDE